MTSTNTPEGKKRHVLGLSGGKDSSALAIYMRDRVPDMEYFFCDTGAELPETYEYLNRLEAAVGKPIVRLNASRDFDHWLEVYQGTLPSPQMRWCTKNLKIRPLEEWVGDDEVISYVAIRADENRLGYVSTKPNIDAVFPFREDGIDRAGVDRILDEAGIGLPAYYEWRTRSGCYFCFFQRKHEWVGLKDRHPELFEKAIAYEEKVNYRRTAMQERQYTWSQGESLHELIERRDEIEAKHEAALERAAKRTKPNRPLLEILSDALDEDDDSAACAVCHL
ncbi:phosphoadenosine phosphosulfate reductase family protein [Streptomyces bauhiniae]|uniref:phosphoadenosine phosphosulfate reductase domain-containing protein n=1 Tax=Streptomyces bauhiniae TaxID=2340725 RepID=UPI003693A4ED